MFVLVATWLSANNHCYLEMAGFLPEDNCHETENASSNQGDPCDTGCKIAEQASYKIQDNDDQLVILFVALPILLEAEPTQELSSSPFAELVTWPPDKLNLTQFLVRTALPIRGPSLVS